MEEYPRPTSAPPKHKYRKIPPHAPKEPKETMRDDTEEQRRIIYEQRYEEAAKRHRRDVRRERAEETRDYNLRRQAAWEEHVKEEKEKRHQERLADVARREAQRRENAELYEQNMRTIGTQTMNAPSFSPFNPHINQQLQHLISNPAGGWTYYVMRLTLIPPPPPLDAEDELAALD